MGYYIDSTPAGPLPAKGKAAALIKQVPGTLLVPPPKELVPDLVCVVENSAFDAAGYCFDARELEEWQYPDPRRKTWLIVPGAAKLSGYER